MNEMEANGKATKRMDSLNVKAYNRRFATQAIRKRACSIPLLAFGIILYILCNHILTLNGHGLLPAVQAASQTQTCRYMNLTNPFDHELKVRLKNVTSGEANERNLTAAQARADIESHPLMIEVHLLPTELEIIEIISNQQRLEALGMDRSTSGPVLAPSAEGVDSKSGPWPVWIIPIRNRQLLVIDELPLNDLVHTIVIRNCLAPNGYASGESSKSLDLSRSWFNGFYRIRVEVWRDSGAQEDLKQPL